MNAYDQYPIGSQVEVLNGRGVPVVFGTIIRQGTTEAHIIDQDGHEFHMPYPLLRNAVLAKTASEVLKEETKNNKKFTLVKEEKNTDGQMSVLYRVLVNDKQVSESEEVILNVYDPEYGWSAPDGFDENKVELLKNTFESGFDLMVESYDNIERQVLEQQTKPKAEDLPKEPVGKPAFVPGSQPKAPDKPEAEATDQTAAPTPESEDLGLDEATEPEAGPAPEAQTEIVGASLEPTSFARSILSSKQVEASELLRNPQHRLNPILRDEMDSRGIDSGETHDLELADKLQDFDYSRKASSMSERIRQKLK